MSQARKTPPKRFPPRMLRVIDATARSSKTRRIRFAPDNLDGLGPHCAAAHIKLFFPREGQERPILPKLGPKGPIWPPPDQKPIVRTYSICEVDEDSGALSVEFVLHDDYGPASDWAQHAQPGQLIGMAGPGPALKVLYLEGRPLIMIGDLSARPAMESILGALDPDRKGHGLCFIPDQAQSIDIPTPKGFNLEWSVRQPGAQPSFVASGELERLVAPYDQGPTPYLWVAGEHSCVVEIRDHLRKRWQLPPNDFYAVPYWRHQQNEEQYHDQRHRVVDDLKSS